jgi:16S rRNA (cytosine967-C5)-methyltransferase
MTSLELLLTDLINYFWQTLDKADLLVQRFCRKHRIGQQQRKALANAFYYYLRHKDQVDFLAGADKSIAQVTLSLIETPASEWPTWQKLPSDQQDQLLASLPPFWYDAVQQTFGELVPSALHFFQQRGGITLLVLLRRNSREQVKNYLAQHHTSSEYTFLSPAGLMITNGKLPSKTDDIFFDVQDESSQVVGMLLQPTTRTCLDLCAGTGGKSIAIGTLWPDIKLLASDVRHEAAEALSQRAKRAGISIKWQNKKQLQRGAYDTVLIDAPCSGSGVWRRNPEDRWRVDELKVQGLVVRQRELLHEASILLAPQGEIIYVTCSFHQQENQENITHFLKHHPKFSVIDAHERLRENLQLWHNTVDIDQHYIHAPYLQTRPDQNRDLFFVAILKRTV